MNDLKFWRSWPPVYRRVGYFLAILPAVAIMAFWIYRARGNDGVITWNQNFVQKPVEKIIHTFNKGAFNFDVTSDLYSTYTYFSGTDYAMDAFASRFFVSILILGFVIILCIITTLERFWFLFGMALMVLFLVSLRLEVLRLPGSEHQIPTIAVVALYGLVAFYFNSLRTSTGFLVRFIIFFLITVALSVTALMFANVPFPALHMAVTGYTAGLILTVIFIFLISHEIPAALVVVISQGTTKSIKHFLIFSAIYMVNLSIAYAHERRLIEWNVYIDAYLIFSISAIVGFWGFRRRQVLYEKIIAFDPFGGFLYLAMAAISFATIGHFLANGNDVALKIIRDLVLFTHLGFGLIFLLYVLSNFSSMLDNGLPVHKVLYKPNRMPYATFQIAGLCATLALLFLADWKQYAYQGVSGFYNDLGDLYVKMERNTIAEAYFEKASSYGFANHHSNYILANHQAYNGDLLKAANYYTLANRLRPTPYSFVNAANSELTYDVFKSISSYRKGLATIPRSGELMINLGYAYSKIHRLDSALMMFGQAAGKSSTKDVAGINFLALAAQEYIPVNADSLLRTLGSKNPGLAANALVLSAQAHQELKTDLDLIPDHPLNLYEATLLHNYIILNVAQVDSAFIERAYAVATDTLNADYNEALRSALAFAYYENQQVYKANEILGELAYTTQSQTGKYNYIMGLWALEQGNPKLAIQCFEVAHKNNYKHSMVYLALAGIEDKQLPIVDSTDVANLTHGDSLVVAQLEEIINLSAVNTTRLTDQQRLNITYYQLKAVDTLAFDRIANEMTTDNIKAKALLEMANRQFSMDRLRKAVFYFNQIDDLTVTEPSLVEKIAHFKFILLATQQQLKGMEELVNDGLTFGPTQQLEKKLYEAFRSAEKGDTATAKKYYDQIAYANPYFEEGIIAASLFYEFTRNDHAKSYDILATAVQANNVNVRLLKHYLVQASRMGLDQYVTEVYGWIDELEKN